MSKILILTAMKEEALHIIKKYDLKEEKNFKNIYLYGNDKIVLCLFGIGKIQATIGTTYCLLNYDIKKVINIGIAGSLLGKEVSIGDVFIVGNIVQHDMYLPFEGEHLDYAKKSILVSDSTYVYFSKLPFNVIKNATCLTGDQFIDDTKKLKLLRDKYNADIVEMEAFAVASVLREFDKLNNAIFIKAISDGADSKAIDAHMSNLDFAMENSLVVLDEILR